VLPDQSEFPQDEIPDSGKGRRVPGDEFLHVLGVSKAIRAYEPATALLLGELSVCGALSAAEDRDTTT
jgi:hypothetical protein